MSLRDAGVCQQHITPTVDGADAEALLQTINCERRRIIAEHVAADRGPDEAATLSELAEHVAAVEFGVDFDPDERKSVYVGLQQQHIERLVEIGVLEPTGQRNGVFTPGSNADAVGEIVRYIDRAASGGGE